MTPRPALSRARIIDAAVTVADAGGLSRVSMRNVAKQAGVEAMSLYHHIAGKDDLLDGLTDWIYGQIELPARDDPWHPAMAARAASARAVLSAHPWALGLVESRGAPGPALLRHHDTVIGCLRRNGFSVAEAAHAFSAIDAYVYGFVLTEQNLPFDQPDTVQHVIEEIERFIPADEYPYLAEMVHDHVFPNRDYSYGDEFEYGLTLILDGLADTVKI